jgi:hypothetical protein
MGSTHQACTSCSGRRVSENLVAEGDYEPEEDEEWWVGTVRIEEMQEE